MIWTDVVQMFVYLAGAVLVFFALVERVPGGWDAAAATASAAGKFVFLNLSTDPKAVYTLWAGIAGGVALTTGSTNRTLRGGFYGNLQADGVYAAQRVGGQNIARNHSRGGRCARSP